MKSHRLTGEVQKDYRYTIGKYAEPVLRIRPGDQVEIETLDAFGGLIKNERSKPSEILKFPNVNPLNGPIVIEGAAAGDTLAIEIKAIKPRGPQPRGTTCLIPHFGGLTTTGKDPGLQDPLPELVRKVEIHDTEIVWNERIRIPYEPFIGTIGTAPELDSINSLTPDSHGGNMDLPDVAPGHTLYLPVRVPGAYLYVGDCHAAQGDGELCGVALEFASLTTIGVNIVKGWKTDWPRVENDEYIMSVGSARPMENAAKTAFMDLIAWMVERHKMDKYEAYFLLTQVARVRLGNMVDPNFTVAARVAKRYLA